MRDLKVTLYFVHITEAPNCGSFIFLLHVYTRSVLSLRKVGDVNAKKVFGFPNTTIRNWGLVDDGQHYD